ncbi:hypothetical protein [Nonomuraea aridisoli]|uniref:FxLD family lantipeptide n=1 Tax=Nonomuraea aridisoli TaxID=2070368 RepID=A0A2W2FAH2_9ACTN|nr:hypothetical protein [Nonomuraea aridisoli]PZG22530.1 hypothetical protein C1J01_03850 [Nonomuraea aridisoli]
MRSSTPTLDRPDPLDSTAEVTPLDVSNLFDLGVQVGPVHDLPAGMDSADCTNDTCTGTCASCGCSGGC